MSKILRYLACLFMLIFAGNALAAGYSCPSYKKYTSCASGYYMTSSSTSTTCDTTAKAGNACRPCSVMGSDYTCAGGTSCPKLNEVTITYNLNGGSGTTPSSKKCTPGTSCSLASGATTSFYRAGYVFKGWSTSSTATSGSTSITFNANDTVYAVWSACAAGTYKAGSGTQASASCSACSGRTKYQNLTGQSSCKTVSSGYYTTGCDSSGNNCTNQSQCPGATYCSGGVQNSCPAQTSGWTRNSGTGWTSYTQCNQTRAATSASTYCSAGTLKQNATSATAWGSTTVSSALSAKAGAYVNGTTCSQCAAGDYCTGGTAARKDCPSGYPNSAAGSDAITDCYSNTKSRPWSGSQVNGTTPTNCYSATWGSCRAEDMAACSYVAYSNSAGTADGTVKSGCTSNSANCTRQVASVTAKSGYFDAGTTCSECPNGYPNSANGNEGGNTKCYASVSGGHYIGTRYSATQSECVGGTYKAAHAVYYGSTSSCSACTGRTKYSGDGASACSTVSSGYYTTGCNTSGNNCTGQSRCTGATYCTGGEKNNCPGSYTADTTAGKTSAQQCKISVAKGHHIATANSSTPADCDPGDYRAAHTVNYGSTSSCSACPSGYTSAAGTAGANTECYISVSGGHYIGTRYSATQSECEGGTYRAAHTVYYGSTSSCSACIGRTKYSGDGASACSTVDSGYYSTGCNTSGNNCTGQSQCTGATYCSGGVQNSCPAQTSGWTRNSGTGWTSYTQCNQTRAATAVSSYCSSGTLKQNATSATAWGASTISTEFQAKAGAYVNGQTCSQCAAGDYCTGGTAAPKDCPSGYPNSAAGAGAITSCYSNSKSRAWAGSQVNGSIPTNCSAVTEWGTCSGSACTYVAYSNSAGTGDGTIKSGCSTNNANCTKPVKAVSAKAGYYDNGTSCSACPTGYPNSDAGNEGGITKCYSDEKSRPWSGSQTACTKPTGCYEVTCNSCSNPACSYVAYANSAGTGDGTIKSGCSTNNAPCTQTVNTVTANAGRYVSGKTCPACAVGTFQGADDSTATSCSVCAANTYAASTGMSACTACPSGYSTSGTAASNHDAKSDCSITCAAGTRVVTADAACTTPTGSWYTALHSVTAGSTTSTATVKACLTNYSTPNTTARTDHDASTDCKISCAAGTRITAKNATSCTTPAGNWYVGAHSVAQGSISSYSNCLTNYTISGTAAANHDTASDCKISCGGGSYIATANNTTCSDVGAGYWAAASTVSQGSAGVRNACDDGLTTIGSGAGADEVGDCGRVLNVNGEKIYLRSERKTTPSLNVSINGTTFYGNMGASGIGALKLNSGGTTYSVYDDSME